LYTIQTEYIQLTTVDISHFYSVYPENF